MISVEFLIGILVAIMLLAATAVITVQVARSLTSFSSATVLNLISNALLLLIIKEIIWTVIKFFKKEDFSMTPLLYIGIISAIREMLFAEIQKSVEKAHAMELTWEILLNALVILILVVAYYIQKKSENKPTA
ncbi:MAG: phosphate-starvation-inducible PsiE family protein [Bacillota bacterium]